MNWQLWFFGPSFPKKGYFGKLHHWILHIWVSVATKFQLKPTISIFRSNFTKKSISGRKMGKHHWILHIQIRVGIFGLKQKNHSIVFTYYSKLSCKGGDRHSGILMSLFLQKKWHQPKLPKFRSLSFHWKNKCMQFCWW